MRKAVCLLALWTGLSDAGATTPAEVAMNNAPMPHVSLRGEPKIRVHLARIQGFREGVPDRQTHMAMLRRDVEQCVARRRRDGMAANPPSPWPDYATSIRKDGYVSGNREITYLRLINYVMVREDCSLHEALSHSANLVSNSGTCTIDLIKKTARGFCDAHGHAHAPPPIKNKPLTAEQAATMEKARNGGMGAAMAEAMRKMDAHKNGPHPMKTLLGVRCEVMRSPGNSDPAENSCIILGVPFDFMASSHTGIVPAIELEARSRHGFNLDPVEARADAEVDPAVFTPYLAGGFAITRTGR